jgi:DNA primase
MMNDDERLSLAVIRGTDMVTYLEKLGYQPEKIRRNGTDFWYLSPLRDERTASFHIIQTENKWYDFGLMTGGDMIDFCLRYYRCSILELLERWRTDSSYRQWKIFDASLHEGRSASVSKLQIKEVRNIYAYPLKNYLHERAIPVSVAEQYCREVSYEISGCSYYGIGFKNDAGGWELRNKNFKQSSSPKDITTLHFGAPSVQVFEGFMDFLSYQVLHLYQEPATTDFVVLNGAGLFDRALPFLERYERVGLWLDRDVTGKTYTEYALSLGPRFRDESNFYGEHKDLNDWLIHKGEVPKAALRPGNRLRPGF